MRSEGRGEGISLRRGSKKKKKSRDCWEGIEELVKVFRGLT